MSKRIDQDDLDPKIIELLEELQTIPPRNQQMATRGRARFLSQAVSLSAQKRQRGWKPIVFGKEVSMNAILSVVLALALIFGGSGATVYAAQGALPDQPLYAVKTWTEAVRLSLAAGPQAEIDQLMQMTEQRTQEMVTLVNRSQVPPENLSLRMQQHIQLALQTSTQLNDADLHAALLRIHTQLQTQEQLLNGLQTQAIPDATPILTRTRMMIQERIRLCEAGLADPQGFRYAVEHNYRYGQTQTPTSTPSRFQGPQSQEPLTQSGPKDGNGSGPSGQTGPNQGIETQTPDNGGKGSPQPVGTPVPDQGGQPGQGGGNKNNP